MYNDEVKIISYIILIHVQNTHFEIDRKNCIPGKFHTQIILKFVWLCI